MGKLKYKGYSGTVEFDDSVDLLVGKVLGLKHALILYEGHDLQEIKKDFEQSIDFYLQECQEEGTEPEKPYSGRIVLRMKSTLHGMAAEKAEAQGISLNEFINRAVQAAL